MAIILKNDYTYGTIRKTYRDIYIYTVKRSAIVVNATVLRNI